MGLANTAINRKNTIFGVYGNSGDMYEGSRPFQWVSKFPRLADGKKLEIWPGAITNWLGKIYIGAGAVTNDATFPQGVYEYGSNTDQIPVNSLSYAFPISTGTYQSTTVKIGMVKSFGKDLYVGWRDGSTYGVDKFSKGNNPQTSGEWVSAIKDFGSHKNKKAMYLLIRFKALEVGESFTPKYAVNEDAYTYTFTTGATVSTVGYDTAKMDISKDFGEICVGFNFTATTTFPKVHEVMLVYDDLSEEKNQF